MLSPAQQSWNLVLEPSLSSAKVCWSGGLCSAVTILPLRPSVLRSWVTQRFSNHYLPILPLLLLATRSRSEC